MSTLLVILVLVLIILGVFTNKILVAVPAIKIPFIIVLSVGTLALAYFIYESIMQPIRFNAEKEIRYEAVKKKLIEIRDAEFAYEEKYGKYTDKWDVLVNFIKNDSLPFVRMNGELMESLTKDKAKELNIEITRDVLERIGMDNNPDSIMEIQLDEARGIALGLIRSRAPEGMTEDEAVRKGYVIRDTTMIPVHEKLFPKDLYPKGYDVDKIMIVPFAENESFLLQAGMVTALASEQPVFEVSVLNTVILNGMDKQLIINFNDELKNLNRFQGLKVGDITTPNGGAGNWD
ncbi:MAG: hypothetical protein A2W91_05155 [Bacteroidetes bacterium GWF2_38_335]|nr:MAG: hypothetical protein A2W91_05155 [Bacteroidetes bacterium GWF2_38_335]OFY79782.1 MAG: hypothetical protein A2281_10265 [Bacteroidetes bacterium RIFOXYA12_FULL_38_20]HBS88170.1 hypothetical protein [Bacteroidales bacterium]